MDKERTIYMWHGYVPALSVMLMLMLMCFGACKSELCGEAMTHTCT